MRPHSIDLRPRIPSRAMHEIRCASGWIYGPASVSVRLEHVLLTFRSSRSHDSSERGLLSRARHAYVGRMFDLRLMGMGLFASSALTLAAPAMPGSCGGAGGSGAAGSGGSSPEAVCGNGIAEGSEACDGADLRGRNQCEQYEPRIYASGTLTCNAECQFDVSGCTLPVCGDSKTEGAEECDGTVGVYDCVAYRPGTYTFIDGTYTCGSDCNWDYSKCVRPVCGNGQIEGTEQCEGTNMGDLRTCSDLGQEWRGELRCGSDCRYDRSQCVGPVCGDGRAEGPETCDGADMGAYTGLTCADLYFAKSIFGIDTNYLSGSLKCRDDCMADRSECVPPPGCYLMPRGLSFIIECI